MTLLFSLIAITSIWCLGIKILTEEGMVLQNLGKWGELQVSLGVKWVEPAFYCQWCMPSIHSLVGFGFAWAIGLLPELSWHLIFFYPLVAMGSSLVNGLVWQHYKNREAAKELVITLRETAQVASDWMDADLLAMQQYENEQTNN